MDFPAALTAAKAGKTISRPSLPDVSLVWVVSGHPSMVAQLVRVHLNDAVTGYSPTVADFAAADWVAV